MIHVSCLSIPDYAADIAVYACQLHFGIRIYMSNDTAGNVVNLGVILIGIDRTGGIGFHGFLIFCIGCGSRQIVGLYITFVAAIAHIGDIACFGHDRDCIVLRNGSQLFGAAGKAVVHGSGRLGISGDIVAIFYFRQGRGFHISGISALFNHGPTALYGHLVYLGACL